MRDRTKEAAAVVAFVAACRVGLKRTQSMRRDTCALTGATIKPYQEIAGIGELGFVRMDAVDEISIRANESTGDVLERFARYDLDLANEWLDSGSNVVVLSAASLRPTLISCGARKEDRERKFRSLRASAFMLRRPTIAGAP